MRLAAVVRVPVRDAAVVLRVPEAAVRVPVPDVERVERVFFVALVVFEVDRLPVLAAELLRVVVLLVFVVLLVVVFAMLLLAMDENF